MKETAINKERLHWVDAAKGILIVLMALGHMFQRGEDLEITCPALELLKNQPIDVSVFYMATFFVISGFWSNYDMSFKDFAVKMAKALLLPLMVFSYFGGIMHELFYEILKHTYNSGALIWPSLSISLDYWFVLALFIAQLACWCVCRWMKTTKMRWIGFVVLYFVGALSLKAWYIPNYACWKWALVMAIYLPMGQVIKKGIHNWWLFAAALVLYLGVYLAFCYFEWGIPYTTGGMKNLDLARAIPSLVLCTTGSFVFLKLCSLIKRARLLEWFGRNTLAIYIMHWWIEILAMKVLRSFFAQGVWMSTAATFVTLAVAVVFPCLVSELLNRPKLKWILGKK